MDASERRVWKQKEKAQSTTWKWKRSKRIKKNIGDDHDDEARGGLNVEEGKKLKEGMGRKEEAVKKERRNKEE